MYFGSAWLVRAVGGSAAADQSVAVIWEPEPSPVQRLEGGYSLRQRF